MLVSTYEVTSIPHWLGTYRWVASRQARSRSSSHVAGRPAMAEPLCSARRVTIPTKSRALGDLVTVTMPLVISKINLSPGLQPIRARIASGTVTCPFAVITGIAGTSFRHQYTICAIVLLPTSGIPSVALLPPQERLASRDQDLSRRWPCCGWTRHAGGARHAPAAGLRVKRAIRGKGPRMNAAGLLQSTVVSETSFRLYVLASHDQIPMATP
jgi:hypothetical protein